MIKGEETKERIKEISMDLFHRRGYRSTSINDIIESTGVKKGNLYYHYPAKDSLVLEVLGEALSVYEKQINSGIKHSAACEQIDDIIEAVTNFHISGDISKGCMFGNMALEIGHDDSEISLFVENVFRRWEKRFETLLARAEKNGEIKLKESPVVLARMILASIEGGVMLAKISGNKNALKDCTGFIRSVLKERRI